MGVGVSQWKLARTVSETGQLGVVSGTALDTVFIRRLQDGDFEGHMRRAMAAFPNQKIVEKVLKSFFIEGGRRAHRPYRLLPLPTIPLDPLHEEIIVLANFVEVWLAKEQHEGIVGINYLHKVQIPHMPALYGALLANVDYVLMGAGIPREIPNLLRCLSKHQPSTMHIPVTCLPGSAFSPTVEHHFVPANRYTPHTDVPLKCPQFLAIISSAALAKSLARHADASVDGFVIEKHTAGGHNAPPRGGLIFDTEGEPVYGARDEVDLEAVRKIGKPFWLAGSCGSPEALAEALKEGARGVQVGTAFAFSRESGFDDLWKRKTIEKVREGQVRIRTNAKASPTGFPFKAIELENTLSDEAVYSSRRRVCDIGLLREIYRKADGSLGYRCPADCTRVFEASGGNPEESAGKRCLCNALLAAAGVGQVRGPSRTEPVYITSGDALMSIKPFCRNDNTPYAAADVICYLTTGVFQRLLPENQTRCPV